MKKVLKITWLIYMIIGTLLLTAIIVFWGIRLSIWYGNINSLNKINMDDGPHIFWLNDSTINVTHFKHLPADNPYAFRKVLSAAQSMKIDSEYEVVENIINLKDTTNILERMDEIFGIEFNPCEKPGINKSEYQAGKIVAVSDIHGCYDQLLALLKNNHIINQETNWIWGDGHLVIGGDVIDKGPGATDCLWLLRKLENQAEIAGGKVHCLFGNHEVALLRESEGRSNKNRRPGNKYPSIGKAIGIPYAQLFDEKSELGRWMRTWNTIVKINDNLFLHAGISNQLLKEELTVDNINNYGRNYVTLEHWLAADPSDRKIYNLFDDYWGPYEYKGYFDDKGYQENFSEKTVNDALNYYDCNRIIVGHSAIHNIHLRHNDKVVAIGIKLQRDGNVSENASAQMLLIKDGKFSKMWINGEQELLN